MIDEIDRKLILELQKDGRQNISDLGKKLFVNEGTVRKRLEKLKSKKIIDVVAIPNLAELGYKFVSIIAVQVEMSHLNEVAEELVKKHSILQLMFVTGRYDLIAIVASKSTEDFSAFMRNELSEVRHVVRTETFMALSIIKGTLNLLDTHQLICDIKTRSIKGKIN